MDAPLIRICIICNSNHLDSPTEARVDGCVMCSKSTCKA